MIAQRYPEGHFQPEKHPVHDNFWNVWCVTGAVRVLAKKEYINFLKKSEDKEYMINFANAAYARLSSSAELKSLMEQISQVYDIKIFPMGFDAKWMDWKVDGDNPDCFDGIRIKNKRD